MIRNSNLAGPKRSASQWINWHKKTIPAAHPLRSMRDIGMAHTIMNRLHRESGEERPERIPYHQYQRWHSSSSSGPKSKKRCIKKHFKGIHDRFLRDPTFRESQLEHYRNEEVCIQMDELAQKDFSYHLTQAEYFRYRKNWWISLNNSGKTGPLRDRSDFNDALTTLNRLHQESGERQLRSVPFWKYQNWHQSSSSSSSWWQWSRSWWSS